MELWTTKAQAQALKNKTALQVSSLAHILKVKSNVIITDVRFNTQNDKFHT